ncbi:PP2C family protein-serine/threonine phosphatase [Thiobacter aerophilum]|uniref:PP2C family serine/threonine-protein phosphatase n=1 Tax=Thiobacter aerophilum TaxID=3121275 RepID=A0ABV0EBT8_9BURK
MKIRNALTIASLSDAGLVRNFNEDSVAVDEDIGLVVVADGMGGYKAGDVAAGMATMIVGNELKAQLGEGRSNGNPVSAEAIRAAVNRANQSIYHAAHNRAQFQGMGATLVMALFHDDMVAIAHAGDSRAYRLRHDKLEQLTVDHSLLQEQLEMGLISAEDARVSHNRNLVTRALGVNQNIVVDVRQERALPGDIYLLCTDGLNDMVDDADIELAMVSLQENIPLLVKQLVIMANDNGGHDNISVAAIRVDRPFPARRGFWGRFFSAWRRG